MQIGHLTLFKEGIHICDLASFIGPNFMELFEIYLTSPIKANQWKSMSIFLIGDINALHLKICLPINFKDESENFSGLPKARVYKKVKILWTNRAPGMYKSYIHLFIHWMERWKNFNCTDSSSSSSHFFSFRLHVFCCKFSKLTFLSKLYKWTMWTTKNTNIFEIHTKWLVCHFYY